MNETLFGEPDEAPRERSLRDQAKAAEVGWRKYSGRTTPCVECTKHRANTGQGGIAAATQTRHEGFDVQYLCGFHAAEIKIQEELDEANSKRRPKEAKGVSRPYNPHTSRRRGQGRY